MRLMNFTQYAVHRGVTKMAVSLAVKQGRISTVTHPETGKRVIDPEVADTEWDQNTAGDFRRNPKNKRPEDIEAEETSEFQASVSSGKDGAEKKKKAPPLAESRAFKEAFNARLAQLEYEVKTEKLVEVDKVKNEAFKVARIVRDSILAVPDRIDADLAATTDRNKVNNLLKQELTKALEELANAIGRG